MELDLKNKDVTMVLGKTGSGKSTMVTSIIYGKDSLEQKRDTVVKGFKKKSLIMHKSEYFDQGCFNIGHSMEPQTFIPESGVCDDENENIMIDTADFFNNDSPMIKLINYLSIRFIFQVVKSIKFIIAITQS